MQGPLHHVERSEESSRLGPRRSTGAAEKRSVGTSREVAIPEQRPLVVAHVVEGCRGGVGTAVRHLICAQALDRGIGSVHLLADSKRMGDMLFDVPATVHNYRSSRNPAHIRRVSREVQAKLKALQPDIVYLHSTFPGVYGRLRIQPERRSWATLYCAHGWAFTQHVSSLRKKFYMGIERYLARHTDAIISISHYEHKAAIRAGIQHCRHQVIPHGIPAADVTIKPTVEVAGDGIQLLFVGRFDQQKGVDLLLNAWKDPRLADMHLWLIGDTTLDSDIEIPTQHNVHCLGWIRNELMDAYIRSFDAVIMPSRWEGFGLVALEAMRNGRPVLASRAGGLPELIIDRVNGRLFEPEAQEELIQMLTDLSKRDLVGMGKHALEVFRAGFEWDVCYQRWRQIALEAFQARFATTS